MEYTEKAKDYAGRFFPEADVLMETDPEFMARFADFAFDEVLQSAPLDDHTRMMAILATLLGCQGVDAYKAVLPGALRLGVTPVEVKEVLYQAVAYLGFGRVYPFFAATNAVFETGRPCTAAAGTGDDDTRRPHRERGTGPSRYFWRWHARLLAVRPCRKPAYQHLAFRQLLWRLLYAQGPRL